MINKRIMKIIEIANGNIDKERSVYMIPEETAAAITGNFQSIVFVVSSTVWVSGVRDNWGELVFVSSEVSCSDTGFSYLL